MADTNVTGGTRRELTKYRVTFAAAVIGLVLARVGGLRLSVGWERGAPRLRFVPRQREELATAA